LPSSQIQGRLDAQALFEAKEHEVDSKVQQVMSVCVLIAMVEGHKLISKLKNI